ncbi:MAG: secretion system protein F [Deltaproteobacteria bacterium]|nr:secretion system protein F [Deltaproteobacteria bacterium]
MLFQTAAVLVFILVAASVFFVVAVVHNILARAWDKYQDRYTVRTLDDFSELVLVLEPRQIAVLSVCGAVLGLMLGILFFGKIWTGMLTVAGAAVPPLLVRRYRIKRLEKFNRQLVDALNQIANALKAGLTLPQAAEDVAAESQAPLAQEFGVMVRELKLGVSLDNAMENMARRVGSEDLDLVVTSTTVARTLGGNMAEMYETVAGTIRERFRLEGRIKAVTSQGKLQGWIVASLPFALWLVMDYMRPDLMEPLFSSWHGYIVIGLILFFEGIGIMLIRRIVNIDV